MPDRTTTERVRATLHRLETDRNVRIATADHHTTRPHLIPRFLAWSGVQVILTTSPLTYGDVERAKRRAQKTALAA